MNIEIIGGGTVYHVRNHLALSAPAYGTTAFDIVKILHKDHPELVEGVDCMSPTLMNVGIHLTRMAGGSKDLETNQDVARLVDRLLKDKKTKIIFFNAAMVDFEGSIATSGPVGYEWADDIKTISGKYQPRLKTSEGDRTMLLTPSEKIISKIRKERKDIFLVGFKTTCGASLDEQFLTGLHLLKTSSCNLVLANDTETRMNMVITPEQARYHVTDNREEALKGLVKMTLDRSNATFTRSTVVEGEAIDWNSHLIPANLRMVVNHCIEKGAYKPFNGATVGHFAVKVNKTDFITSKRKVNFNHLKDVGMVLCRAEGDDKVTAYGHKPSVGGQSQRIIFRDHPGMDCIVHFHCPPKPGVKVSTRSQASYECGSHQCGVNTSKGLAEVGDGIKCVMLDNHGPNIVFNRNTPWEKVVEFIDNNFDLAKATDGVDRNKVSVA